MAYDTNGRRIDNLNLQDLVYRFSPDQNPGYQTPGNYGNGYQTPMYSSEPEETYYSGQRTPKVGDELRGLGMSMGKDYLQKQITSAVSPRLMAMTGSGAANSAASMAPSGLGSIGSTLPYAAAAYTAYDLFTHKQSHLGGAAKGAAAGTMIYPGIGTAIGALVGLASSFVNPGYSKLEEDKRKQLAAAGIDLGADKAWEHNPAFAKSRKESDLTAGDITSAADLYLQLGPKYAKASEDTRRLVAQEALNRGLIREHNGGISLEERPQDFMEFADRTLLPAQAAQGVRSSAPKKETKKKEPFKSKVSLAEMFPKFEAYTGPKTDFAEQARLADYYLSKRNEKASRQTQPFNG